jgi:hypothetical protein
LGDNVIRTLSVFSQNSHINIRTLYNIKSFDIESGKHFLIDEQGRTTCINKIGTFNPNFRPYYSGFVNHKARYKDAAKDPSVLHFAPDMNFKH